MNTVPWNYKDLFENNWVCSLDSFHEAKLQAQLASLGNSTKQTLWKKYYFYTNSSETLKSRQFSDPGVFPDSRQCPHSAWVVKRRKGAGLCTPTSTKHWMRAVLERIIAPSKADSFGEGNFWGGIFPAAQWVSVWPWRWVFVWCTTLLPTDTFAPVSTWHHYLGGQS